jgi:excisionase family DNA binding protein
MERISISRAAQLFGVSRRTIERWVSDGRLLAIPSPHDARHRLIESQAVESLVDNMPKRTASHRESGVTDQSKLTEVLRLASEQEVAAQYHHAVDTILMRVYGRHQRLISYLHPDIHAELTLDELHKGPLGRDLQSLAAYALSRTHEPGNVILLVIDLVLQSLFSPAAAESFTIPRSFWDTDLGRMISRAKLRALRPDDLVSVDDAERMLGVTTPTVYRWMDDRTLGWVRDDANGRTWVVRRDVENLKRVATELLARQAHIERALAS